MDPRYVKAENKNATFTMAVSDGFQSPSPATTHQLVLEFSAGIAAGSTLTISATAPGASVAAMIDDGTFDAASLAGTSKMLMLSGVLSSLTFTLTGFATGSVSAFYVGY